ncbi:MAG: zinc-ribbon domain containing protein [Firmicutes bacterium]|nr:zinc-ribbon domain containing protein [Dethiobacter sp.]MBS3887791.1 zinc-ribbon domain containing protein [Bacillota bacterium]MBS4055128.1 zinc-ribbon domain containing protein [Thermaerobacter sp.]
MMQDKNLNCKDCGAEFAFTTREQEFYAERGFQNEPSRCKTCRDSRKRSNEGSAPMNNRELHNVSCDECGANTQVPFKPTAGRPVYCRDCFSSKRR